MARPQGREALGACAHERMWAIIDALPQDSPLAIATTVWLRATFDSLSMRAIDQNEAFEAVERLREEHLPSPAVLNAWMHAVCDLRYTRKTWEVRVRTWIDQAWEQGVLPDAGEAWGDLRHVLAPLRVLQGGAHAQNRRWLVDCCATASPSPDWMCAVLAEIRFGHHAPGLAAIFQDFPRLPESYVWAEAHVQAWQTLWPVRTDRLDKKSQDIQVQVRMQALAWGLANGLPVDTLLSGSKAFLPTLMNPITHGEVDREDLLMGLFELAFVHGLSLHSPVGSQKQPWHAVLQADTNRWPMSPKPKWTPALAFWRRRHAEVECLEAQVRAKQLDASLASVVPPRPPFRQF